LKDEGAAEKSALLVRKIVRQKKRARKEGGEAERDGCKFVWGRLKKGQQVLI